MRSTVLLLLLLSFMNCSKKYNTPIILTLDKNWSYKSTIDSIWKKAEVPGNIHTDLLNNNVIPHPFKKDNAKDIEWISETDWEYKTTFSVDTEILNKKHIDLYFQGLDTYATVFLNDSLILNTNNAFKAYIVNIKPIIRAANQLKIVFKNSSYTEEKA